MDKPQNNITEMLYETYKSLSLDDRIDGDTIIFIRSVFNYINCLVNKANGREDNKEIV